jgi:hypothetical protein
MRSVLFFLAATACGAQAAEAPPRTESSASATSPILVPKAQPESSATRRPATPAPAPPTRRAISPEMMAQLKTIGQQRLPPAKAAQDAPPSPTGDIEATDAVQLAPFEVKEEKYPDFPLRRMLDARGHLDRHYKREPGLRLGAMSLGNDIVAKERNEIELAHERGREMKDLYDLARITAPPRALKSKVDESRSRTLSDAPQSGGAFKEKK